MRLYITHDKEALTQFACEYLSKLLKDKRVELIINGNKKVGVVEKLALDADEDFIVISFNSGEEKIPLLDETKARFGKELIVFETKSHTTVIEVLE